jgi:Tfp pilus assembly protein FimV
MTKIRAMSNAAKASAPAAAEPAPVVPAALTRPPTTPINNPVAEILAPFTGMPPWLVDILLATGLVVAAAYGTEPVLVLARRRQRGGQSTRRRG